MGSVYLNERMLNRGKSVRNGWSELPTHAKGDGMGFRSQHFD